MERISKNILKRECEKSLTKNIMKIVENEIRIRLNDVIQEFIKLLDKEDIVYYYHRGNCVILEKESFNNIVRSLDNLISFTNSKDEDLL